MNNRRLGLTAIEVLVSTLLASLLMVAMLSVLRGLKAQEAALNGRLPVQNWQRVLDAVLQRDLENSRSYELTSTALVLRGYAGRDAQTGRSTWKPTTVRYEIVNDGNRTWLTRRELTAGGPLKPELVLADVTALRATLWTEQENRDNVNLPPPAATSPVEAPIIDGLVLEFRGTDQGGPSYGFSFRRP